MYEVTDKEKFNFIYDQINGLLNYSHTKLATVKLLSIMNNLLFFGSIISMFVMWDLIITILAVGTIVFCLISGYILSRVKRNEDANINNLNTLKFNLDFVKSWENI
jgi:hypothetical protein